MRTNTDAPSAATFSVTTVPKSVTTVNCVVNSAVLQIVFMKGVHINFPSSFLSGPDSGSGLTEVRWR